MASKDWCIHLSTLSGKFQCHGWLRYTTHIGNVHSGKNKREYNCRQCNSRFGDNYQLKQHVKQSHRVPASNGVLPLNCFECGNGFLSRADFLTHKRSHDRWPAPGNSPGRQGFAAGLSSHPLKLVVSLSLAMIVDLNCLIKVISWFTR